MNFLNYLLLGFFFRLNFVVWLFFFIIDIRYCCMIDLVIGNLWFVRYLVYFINVNFFLGDIFEFGLGLEFNCFFI